MQAEFYSFIVRLGERESQAFFQTTSGEIYAALFVLGDYDPYLNESAYLREHGYAFSIYPQQTDDATPHGIDSRLGATVQYIITDFLREHPAAVILYHCDSNDSRQAKRQMRFSRWFDSAAAKAHYKKIDAVIERAVVGSEGKNSVKNYLGLIGSRDNPHLAEAEQEFEMLVGNLGVGK